jgi:hypothetical protein
MGLLYLLLAVYDIICSAESMYKTCMYIGKCVKKKSKLPLYMIEAYGELEV